MTDERDTPQPGEECPVCDGSGVRTTPDGQRDLRCDACGGSGAVQAAGRVRTDDEGACAISERPPWEEDDR